MPKIRKAGSKKRETVGNDCVFVSHSRRMWSGAIVPFRYGPRMRKWQRIKLAVLLSMVVENIYYW